MTKEGNKNLGKTLWYFADQLRGAMYVNDFRDYMLAFLFVYYLSGNYERAAMEVLGANYPDPNDTDNGRRSSLSVWYENNEDKISDFENKMRLKTHYCIKPEHLWVRLAHKARVKNEDLLNSLQDGFKYIENKSFQSTFSGLFSEINLSSEKLGKNYSERNATLCKIIATLDKVLLKFSISNEELGDAYEYLIDQFAAVSGKKSGEFYTPQKISTILSEIVTLDGHNPKAGKRDRIDSVLDFACGSGSLLLNVRKTMSSKGINKLFGQEKNITTYNLARMNMLLHGVKDTEFEIYLGDTLTNDWPKLSEKDPSKKPSFDAIVANPPFSYRWGRSESMGEDARFKNYGLAPKYVADSAFLLHGFHYLDDNGVMAIILHNGVLIRGGVDERIRHKLLEEGHIDTVIGLPDKLFYSTGIPVCILVLKKCKKTDDVLFINASEHFEKEYLQNKLTDEHIKKIIDVYKERPKKIKRYSRCVELTEIRENNYNLNVARYVSTAKEEEPVDLTETFKTMMEIDKQIQDSISKYNKYLKELGLPPLP